MKSFKLLWYVITSCIILSTTCMHNNNSILTTYRIASKNMISSEGGITIDEEFQLTLLPDRNTFLENTPPKQYAFLTLIPNIGHYQVGYPMRSRLALIQANPIKAKKSLPSLLQKAINSMHIPENAKIEYVIVIYGLHVVKKVKESDKKDPVLIIVKKKFDKENIVLHPWANTWKKKLYFSVHVPMGIFNPDGIKPLDLGLNSFRSLKVTPHSGGGVAFSPNNAKFSIYPPNREISSSWFAGISPNKKNVMIAFIVLANTDNAEKIIITAIKNAITLQDFLTKLSDAANFFKKDDQKALNDAVKTIKNIALGQQVSDKPTPDFTSATQLTIQLTQLNKALTNLQKALLA